MRLTAIVLNLVCILSWESSSCCEAFLSPSLTQRMTPCLPATSTTSFLKATNDDDDQQAAERPDGVSEEVWASLKTKLNKETPAKPKKKDNPAMAFLRQKGKVGGAANKDFVNAIGSDEGATGKVAAAKGDKGAVKKAKAAYVECSKSGIIDDLSDPFPFTSSGREWRGLSDRIKGGQSDGQIRRDNDVKGRVANVLLGRVSLNNDGGFLQMVTDLALDPAATDSVDASDFDGIEIDVLCRNKLPGKEDYTADGDDTKDQQSSTMPQRFNIHLRTPGSLQDCSYRHTCEVEEEDEWTTVLIPWSSFIGCEVPLDVSVLRRLGIVAIGEEMDAFVAIAGIRFYSVF